MSPATSKIEFVEKSGNIVKRYRGLSRSRSEFTLRPLSRRSPTDLTLISCANAAKVGFEPNLTLTKKRLTYLFSA